MNITFDNVMGADRSSKSPEKNNKKVALCIQSKMHSIQNIHFKDCKDA